MRPVPTQTARPVLRLAAAFCLATTCAALPTQQGHEPPRKIRVDGEGSVQAVPDRATVTIGVDTQAATVADALAQNSAQARAVTAELERLEVEAKDIATTEVSLSPVFAKDERGRDTERVTGYRVANRVMVRVDDLARLGTILAATAEVGANRVQNLSFGFHNERALLDEARKLAVADALAKARLYAEAAGVELGEILSIAEPDSGTWYTTYGSVVVTGSLEPLPISAGVRQVDSRVIIELRIAPRGT